MSEWFLEKYQTPSSKSHNSQQPAIHHCSNNSHYQQTNKNQ
jgi:hypothetical protein